MSQKEIEKISNLIHDKFESLNKTLSGYSFLKNKWINKLNELEIQIIPDNYDAKFESIHRGWSYGLEINDFIFILDPCSKNSLIKISLDTATKLLVLGVP
jgi:hypothetical protein